MDHLPLPSGAAHIELPYLAVEEYDGDTFCKYPRRKKWTEAELKGENANGVGGRTSEELSAFFQTWLFFGCLITVFRCVGVNVKSSDFIRTGQDGKKVITTRLLPILIQRWRKERRYVGVNDPEWKERTSALTSRETDRSGAVLALVELILRDHRRYIREYCGKGTVLPSQVVIAIATVQWTLLYWAKGIHHSNWNSANEMELPEKAALFLKERMVRAGWCPSEAVSFIMDVEIDGLYYIGSLKSPRYEDDHSRCTDDYQECRYKAKDWKYTTRHASDGCDCKSPEVAPELLDIIRNGGVPIMSLVEGELRATKFDPVTMRYVAISHVWSDGMGNGLDNTLPLCQITRLQRLADEVDHRRRTEPPPRPIQERMALASSGNLPPQENHMDRYANTKLVGFWMDTLCVPVHKEDYEHRISQIHKMHDIYNSASCVLTVDHWIQEIPTSASVIEKSSRLYLSNWQRRLWTCQEGALASTLYFQFRGGQQNIVDLTDEAGLYNDGPRESTLPRLVLNSIPAFNGGKLENWELDMKITPILMAIRSRTTTKRKDETVCLATLLQIAPNRLLKINDGEDICERRMQKFIEMVGFVPQRFIFTKAPRLRTPGYRWAPRSILGQNFRHPTDRLGYLWPGNGLIVKFPAYLLGPISEQPGSSINISDGKKHYSVELCPDDGAEFRQWKEGKRYAILTSSSKRISDAILCIREGKAGGGLPIRKLGYLCRVTMKALKQKKKGFFSFEVREKGEWCVS